MSYLRYGSVYRFVQGESKDYIFPGLISKVQNPRPYFEHPEDYDTYMEDYGKVTNESIIELIWRHWKAEDSENEELKTYLLQSLAKNLDVKIRPRALTAEEAFNIYCNEADKWCKEHGFMR